MDKKLKIKTINDVIIINLIVNVTFVELTPRLSLNEEPEEQEADGYHGVAQGIEKFAETDAALEVDAEGDGHAIGNECTMNPAESESKGGDEPSERTQQGAVENPLRRQEYPAAKKTAAVNEHDKTADWRYHAYQEAACAPQPAFTKAIGHRTVKL